MSDFADEPTIVRPSLPLVLLLPVTTVAITGALFFQIKDEEFRYFLVLIGGLATLVAMLAALLWSRCTQTFTRTAIASSTLLGGWNLPRSEIVGWRRLPAGRYTYVLEFTDRTGRTYNVPETVQAKTWTSGLPNLDVADQAESDRRIAADDRLGASPSARLFHARVLTGGCLGLCGVQLVLGFVARFMHAGIQPALLLSTGPFLALFAAGWLRAKLQSPGSAPSGAETRLGDLIPLGLIFLATDFGLLFALLNCRFEHLDRLVLPGLLIGALLLAAVVALEGWPEADRRKWRGRIVGAAGVIVFGVPFAATLDCALDQTAPALVRPHVLAKSVSRRRHTTYWLTVSPWGDSSQSREENVSPSLYDRLQPGDPICVSAHPGALGAPWHELAACA